MMPRIPVLKSLLVACSTIAASAAIAQVAAPDGEPGTGQPPAQNERRPGFPGQANPKQSPAPSDKNTAQKPEAPPLPYHKKVLLDPPKSPKARADAMANLYALLATAEDEKTGQEISGVIERFWVFGHGDTVAVLMQRGSQAMAQKKEGLALKFFDAVVELAPDYAEGWHQRAVLNYSQNNFAGAMGDLRRVLALDPNHYKALEGLSRMLEETGQKAGALAAHRQLMAVNPFWPGAKERLRELEREAEGQGI